MVERNIDILILRYLNDEALDHEIDFIDQWKNQSQENKKYFEDVKKLTESISLEKELLHFDTEKAWEKYKVKITEPKKENKIFQLLPYHYWLAAASILVFIVLGFFLLKKENESPHLIVVKNDGILKEVRLNDGSAVFLNTNATIEYDSNLFNQERVLYLKGEAFFKVKHDDKRVFCVKTNNLTIKDIGTSFNIKANSNDSIIIIYVDEGVVEVASETHKEVVEARESVFYNKKNKRFDHVGKVDENIIAYKTKVFNFKNTDLSQAVELLNKVYSSEIKIANKKLEKCKLTVTFNNENINDIVDIISETLVLNVKKDKGTIILEGEGCE